MNGINWKRGTRSTAVIAAVWAVVVGLFVMIDGEHKAYDQTVVAINCDTWPIKKEDYGDTRWFADGVASIDKAKTESEARDAAEEWLNRVERDPLLLSAAAKTFLDKGVKQSDLVDDGCASDKAVDTVMAIEKVIAESKVSAVDSAPADTITTGVEDGQMVSLDTTGNDRAIEIVKPSGETVWIERDCGNVVTEYKHRKFPPSKHKPPRHRKPTPTPPVRECPPSMPHGTWPNCKDDPSRQPTGRTGSGRNQDSGPGTYIPPEAMERPPAAPRTNPPPPPPAPRPPSDPEPAPRPEPTFDHPDPEPSAAPEDDPVEPDEGSGCAPGLSC